MDRLPRMIPLVLNRVLILDQTHFLVSQGVGVRLQEVPKTFPRGMILQGGDLRNLRNQVHLLGLFLEDHR